MSLSFLKCRRSSFLLFVLLFYSFQPFVFAQQMTREKILNVANMAFRTGEPEKAEMLYRKIIEQDPRYAPAYNGLGLVFQSRGKEGLREAIRYFRMAVEIDPRYVECWNNLARAYYTQGNFPEVEKAFLKSLEIDPAQPGAHLSLAWGYLLGQSRADDAITHFKEALKDINDDRAYYGLGLAYVLKGDRIKVLDQITELRRRQKEEEASKLEQMVRSEVKVVSRPGTPLVTGVEEQASVYQETLEDVGGTKGVDVDKRTEGIQVRLKGDLWD